MYLVVTFFSHWQKRHPHDYFSNQHQSQGGSNRSPDSMWRWRGGRSWPPRPGWFWDGLCACHLQFWLFDWKGSPISNVDDCEVWKFCSQLRMSKEDVAPIRGEILVAGRVQTLGSMSLSAFIWSLYHIHLFSWQSVPTSLKCIIIHTWSPLGPRTNGLTTFRSKCSWGLSEVVVIRQWINLKAHAGWKCITTNKISWIRIRFQSFGL